MGSLSNFDRKGFADLAEETLVAGFIFNES